LVARGVEGTKVATRQYAKRQVSWIRNKLLPAVRAVNEVNRRDSTDDAHDVLPTYLLDATGNMMFVMVRDFRGADECGQSSETAGIAR
jgi:hypothetical protein